MINEPGTVLCRVRQSKKAEEDATFYLIKDGTFLSLFCQTNPVLFTRCDPMCVMSCMCFVLPVLCPCFSFTGMAEPTSQTVKTIGRTFTTRFEVDQVRALYTVLIV
jgi:hypothetical protein